MNPAFETRLQEGDVAFDATDAVLLRSIDEKGSLNAAASDLGRSYARAHVRLKELEGEFGPLVDRQRGGAGGGGSRLTENAHRLLSRFERLRSAFSGTATAEESVLEGQVVGRDGELATVETPAGRIRALTPEGAETVQVAVRSDAVTLHDPSEAPAAGGTSARNRFDGSVEQLDRGTAIARVVVDVGTPTPLIAVVTLESIERLSLDQGAPTVASFKATATYATPHADR